MKKRKMRRGKKRKKIRRIKNAEVLLFLIGCYLLNFPTVDRF